MLFKEFRNFFLKNIDWINFPNINWQAIVTSTPCKIEATPSNFKLYRR